MGRQQFKQHLILRYRLIGRYTGFLFYVIGAVTAAPILLIFFYPQEAPSALWFAVPSACVTAAGYMLRRTAPKTGTINLPEGSVIVTAAWVTAILCGSVPFLFSGYSFTCAVFESTSGWTTTGLSVVDVAGAGKMILFFRSLMQYAGGAGLAIFLLSLMAGTPGTGLSFAEGHSEQLIPNVRQSARLVMMLYSSYAVIGIIMLKAAGMNTFDALCHSFSALSTGGFSTHAQSAAYWNSASIETVLMVLMIMGSTNFLTAYTLFKRRFRAVAANSELRLSAVLIILFTGLILMAAGKSFGLRGSLFQTLTALTTTGFSAAPVSGGNGVRLAVIILMICGSGTGSTAGGIKLYRIYLLIKGVKNGVKETLLPNRAMLQDTIISGVHRRALTDRDYYTAYRYIALYIFTWLAGSLILSLCGYSLGDSLFEFASALGTVGLTSGITSADASGIVLWTETAGMILGRLEFFVILWGIYKIMSDTPEMLSR